MSFYCSSKTTVISNYNLRPRKNINYAEFEPLETLETLEIVVGSEDWGVLNVENVEWNNRRFKIAGTCINPCMDVDVYIFTDTNTLITDFLALCKQTLDNKLYMKGIKLSMLILSMKENMKENFMYVVQDKIKNDIHHAELQKNDIDILLGYSQILTLNSPQFLNNNNTQKTEL